MTFYYKIEYITYILLTYDGQKDYIPKREIKDKIIYMVNILLLLFFWYTIYKMFTIYFCFPCNVQESDVKSLDNFQSLLIFRHSSIGVIVSF